MRNHSHYLLFKEGSFAPAPSRKSCDEAWRKPDLAANEKLAIYQVCMSEEKLYGAMLINNNFLQASETTEIHVRKN